MLYITLHQPGLQTYELKEYSSVWGEWGANKMGFVFIYTQQDIPKAYLNRGTVISLYYIDPVTKRNFLLRKFFLLNWNFLVRSGSKNIALFGNDIHFILRYRVLDKGDDYIDKAQRVIYHLLNITIGQSTENDPWYPSRKGRWVPEIVLPDDGNEAFSLYEGPYVSVNAYGVPAWDVLNQIFQETKNTIVLYISEISATGYYAYAGSVPFGKHVTLPYKLEEFQTFDQRIKYDQTPTVIYAENPSTRQLQPFFADQYVQGVYRIEMLSEAFEEQSLPSDFFMAKNEVSLTLSLERVPLDFIKLRVGDAAVINDYFGHQVILPVMGFRINVNKDERRNEFTMFAGIKGMD